MRAKGTLGEPAGNTPLTGRVLSRQDFLRMSGAGLLALMGIKTRPAFGRETGVSAPDLGISEDNTAAQNRENLVKALSYSDRGVTFPPGDFLVDNGSYIKIEDFEGELTMEPGARFVFTDDTRRGLNFQGGAGARFYNLSSTFQSLPSSRVGSEECITFLGSTDTLVRDANIDGSAAAGLLFWRCIRPSVDGATIRNTMADGLHFANCQDARASRILTEDTGDDGLAFLNYGGDNPDYSGGYATNITVKRSGSRGIAVVGQRDVTIEGFTVDTTKANGLYCAYEASYDTRVPGNVVFKNGSVYRGGEVGGTSNYGINIDGVESVEFSDIKVTSPGARGVSSLAPEGTVRLSDIEVRDAPESGFDLQGGAYYLNDLTTSGSGGTGVYVAGSRLVRYGSLWAINSSKSDNLRRAFSFEKNARVLGEELHVVDDQGSPTGYQVGAYGAQSGRLGRIYDKVANAEVQVENPSGLAYRRKCGRR